MPKLRPGDVPLTPQEDAAVNAGIATDPDTFELDEAWFANAHPAIEVGPETVKRWRRSRGKKKAEDDVTVRIDADIAAYFRESGPGWLGPFE
jgi:uncharacterized protein (DUF4415 family)